MMMGPARLRRRRRGLGGWLMSLHEYLIGYESDCTWAGAGLFVNMAAGPPFLD